MAKLTIAEELEKQRDVARLHEWVKGEPSNFMSACLVVRIDSKRELTPDQWAEEHYANDDGFWYERTDDGGYKLYAPAEFDVLTEKAQALVREARLELGFKVKEDDQIEDSYDPFVNDANMAWNDAPNTTREQVVEVLTLAYRKAVERFSRRAA